jgi:hypothetical protein
VPAVAPERLDAYPVEVSGWDLEENFFVEKTELLWSEPAGKHIRLRRDIPQGTLIFLRLLDPFGLQRPSPVAYRAEYFAGDGAGEVEPRSIRLLPAQEAGFRR